jgi:hypothetical protein
MMTCLCSRHGGGKACIETIMYLNFDLMLHVLVAERAHFVCCNVVDFG